MLIIFRKFCLLFNQRIWVKILHDMLKNLWNFWTKWRSKGNLDNGNRIFFASIKKYLSSGATKAFSEILSSSPISLTLGMNLEVNLFLLFSGIRLPIRQKKKEKLKTTGITLFIHRHSELKLMISFGNSWKLGIIWI